VAKSNDNAGAGKPEETPEIKSALVMRALGDHAEQQGLMQGEGEEEIHFAVRCIEKLGELVTAMDGNIRTLETDLKAVNRRLASQRGATTKAKSKIVELEEAGKPRKLGPMAAVFDDPAEAFTVDDVMTAIDGADEVVLAFSDGTDEIKGIKPRLVRADAFRFTRGRLHFIDDTLAVTGPGNEETPTTVLAGVALLVDGEQVAWSPMAQPLNIGAGQTINLAGSVIFG
jgi:hypothetical protein